MLKMKPSSVLAFRFVTPWVYNEEKRSIPSALFLSLAPKEGELGPRSLIRTIVNGLLIYRRVGGHRVNPVLTNPNEGYQKWN